MVWIFGNRGANAVQAVEVANDQREPAPGLAAIEAAIDLVIAGRYHSVPNGACPVTAKIKDMARRLEAQAQATLKLDVELSVNINEAVTKAAGMMRDVGEVDRRSQAIAAAAEELVSSVAEIARTSESAATDAGSAQEVAAESHATADQAIDAMRAIAGAVQAAAAKVDSLAQASVQIGDIVNQIEEIAQQTNLLALNATKFCSIKQHQFA